MRTLDRLCCVFVLSLCGACAAAPHEPMRPVVAGDVSQRRTSIDGLARTCFEAMRAQRLDSILVGRNELDELLTPDARLRAERERAESDGRLTRPSLSAGWGAASYSGFCAQGAREEPAGSAGYGLRTGATVVDRVLVVGDGPTGQLAAWVEGRFIYTNRGWRALSVSRVEDPRAHHTDLEVAPCDVEQGIR